MTGRKKRGGKKQNKKNNKKSTREEDVPRNVSTIIDEHVEEHVEERVHVEELSDRNDTDGVSTTSQECQPLPPEKLYFKNTEFTKTCKIQSRCYVRHTVEILKQSKFKPELEWFKNHPQWCHFFHMPDEPNLKLLGMWTLLLHTVPLDESEEAAWFAVNGVPIRYSLREHGLISGLDCHEYPDQYEKLGRFAFVDRHFKSHKEITTKAVEEKLSSLSACGDRLRMAVLYFLGTVIRGRGKYNAPFDSFILRVVNNVEVCKTIPWGRLTFDDAIRSINHVMKHLKGNPKKNVNFLGFIIPLEVLIFECIPALNAKFREGVPGCMSECPRMCKRRFQNNSMKGYPLEDLYDTLGETKVIESVLDPNVDEVPLMVRIMEKEPDYEKEDGVTNLWSAWLTVKQKPIFWQDLYELDVAAREFPKKKEKEKRTVNEEASSSNHSLENALKGIEERLMTCLSEVIVKVETMDKRLCVVEKKQDDLKRKAKKIKAIEKRLEGIDNCQYFLRKKGRKLEAMEARLDGIEKTQGLVKKNVKRMTKKLREKENVNSGGFKYHDMDFDWERGGYDINEEVAEDAQMAEEEAVEKENEEEAVEKESEEPEKEAQAEESEKEVQNEAEEEVAEDAQMAEEDVVEKESEEEAVEKESEDEAVEKEAQAEEPEKEVQNEAEEEVIAEEPEKEVLKEAEEEVQNEVEAELSGGRIYTEEEKKDWILTVCNTSYVHDVGKKAGTDEASTTPARVGIKLRNKCAAKRKYAPAKRPRGRPKKSDTPQKFTPPPAKKACVPSQWVQSPFTKGKSDETEEPKKKRKTKA